MGPGFPLPSASRGSYRRDRRDHRATTLPFFKPLGALGVLGGKSPPWASDASDFRQPAAGFLPQRSQRPPRKTLPFFKPPAALGVLGGKFAGPQTLQTSGSQPRGFYRRDRRDHRAKTLPFFKPLALSACSAVNPLGVRRFRLPSASRGSYRRDRRDHRAKHFLSLNRSPRSACSAVNHRPGRRTLQTSGSQPRCFYRRDRRDHRAKTLPFFKPLALSACSAVIRWASQAADFHQPAEVLPQKSQRPSQYTSFL